MTHIVIQVVAFLFIVFTPILNWFAFPLYLLFNALLAPASLGLILATSKQKGSQLVVERYSAAWIAFQIWYWTNVVLAIPCFLFALSAIFAILLRS